MGSARLIGRSGTLIVAVTTALGGPVARADVLSIVKERMSGAAHRTKVRVAEVINRSADPALLLALIEVESRFRHRAESPVGALGLVQLMPETFMIEARRVGLRHARVEDPETNVVVGESYLRRLRCLFGSWRLALAAYNWGPGNVIRRRIPRSVRRYVDDVLRIRQSYQASLERPGTCRTGGPP